MVMAWNKAHTGKPVWAGSGGPELPLLYMASAAAIGVTGPGRYSLDEMLGIDTPTFLVAATAMVSRWELASVLRRSRRRSLLRRRKH